MVEHRVIVPLIERSLLEMRQQFVVSCSRNPVSCGHDTVSQRHGFHQKALQIVHYEQSVLRLILRVKQLDVGCFAAFSQVIMQYGEVKQQLHVVLFKLLTAVQARFVPLNVHVPSRLLLHKEPEVGGHEVYTTLQSQSLTHERGLQNHLFTTVLSHKQPHHLLQISHLLLRVGQEAGPVPFLAAGYFQCLLLQVGAESVVYVIICLVDDVVQGRPCEVTQQRALRVYLTLQRLHEVGEGVVAIVVEARRKATNINQVIGFHHHKSGH